jgi:hypothetical protein
MSDVSCRRQSSLSFESFFHVLVLFLFASSACAVDFLSNSWIQETNTLYENQPIRVLGGATLTVDGTHQFTSLTLRNNSALTHSAGVSNLHLIVTNGVAIEDTSRIDVTGKGDLRAEGMGSRAGGSHGGRGYSSYSNPTHGDYQRPTDLGTGGTRNDESPTTRGGGRIWIETPDLLLDGGLCADGEQVFDCGSGSGGSILLEVGTLHGSGWMTANGRDSMSYTPPSGGGRIAVHYTNAVSFDWSNIQCRGGAGSGENCGGAGTIYLRDTASATGRLILANGGAACPLASPVTSAGNEIQHLSVSDGAFLDLTLTNAASLATLVLTGATLTVTGDMSIPDATIHASTWTNSGRLTVTNTLALTNGTVLCHGAGYSNGLYLVVGAQLNVASGSTVNVTGLGDIRAVGMGGYAGGSHGGRGANNSNPTYGNYQWPTNLGTGGTQGDGSPGSLGGGAIRIETPVLVLDGELRADGGQTVGASGSGGSILINAGTLRGSGWIRANGRDYISYGGASGGGRIALHYTNASLFDLSHVECKGGAGPSGASGGAGTMYFRDTTSDETWLALVSGGTTSLLTSPVTLGSGEVENFRVGGGANVELTLTNAVSFKTFSFTDAVLSVTGNLTVPDMILDGGTWTYSGVLTVTNSLTLTNGVVMRHEEGYTNGLHLVVGTCLNVASGSAVDVTGLGDIRAVGMGGYAGGSHGGRGANNSNPTYGDYQWPTNLGTGGTQSDGSPGSRGGGAIRIETPELALDGELRADGEQTIGASGSGGSILLNVGTLKGSGWIHANGRDYIAYGGASGGGRIALHYTNAAAFDLSHVECRGGLGTVGSGSGGAGTIYGINTSDADAWLTLANGGVTSSLPSPVTIELGDIDNLSVLAGAWLTCTLNSADEMRSINLSNAVFGLDGALTVTGHFEWAGGTIAMTNGAHLINAVGSVATLSADGTVTNAGNACSFRNDGSLSKSGGEGAAVFRVSFTNAGQVEIGTGTLQFVAGYVQTESGSLRVSMGGASHPPIGVMGPAELDGLLQTSLSDGFVPIAGYEFAILTTTQRIGRFSTISLPPSAGALSWEAVYLPTQICVRAFGDADVDCMPDAWEVQHGLNTNLNDSALDKDGDGFLNGNEYRANTKPDDPGSELTIERLLKRTGAGTVIEWQSASNVAYRISWSTNLHQGFSPLTGELQSTPNMNSYTDAIPEGASAKFYRIELEE